MAYFIHKQLIPADVNAGDPNWAKRQIWVLRLNSNDTKRKEILRLIGRQLKNQALSSDMDFSILNPDKIIDNLKYYPATGKIVGQLPKFLFKIGSNPSIKTSKFAYDVSKIIPSIEIKKK